jgi:hypothetical protein
VIEMETSEEKNNHQIIEMLESLPEPPRRDPRKAAWGKANFLVEARTRQEAVSSNPIRRLNQWIVTKPFIGFRKERSTMKTVFVSILLALAIVLGGGGATAYAAQDSIPTDTLYPVKLFLEDAQYSLTTDPIEKVELLVTFANTRIAEIAALAEEGEEIPIEVTDDLQNELQAMLILAAGLDEANTTSVLLHIRDNLRTQDQLMTNATSGAPEGAATVLELARAVLQNQHRVAELGLDEPLQFRQMFGYHKTDDTEDPVDPDPEVPPDDPYPEPEPSEEPTNGDCPNPEDCVPVGDGPFPQGNPEAGNDNENGNNGDDNGNNGGDNGNDGGQSGSGGVNVGGYYVTVNGSLYYYANGNYTYIGNGQNGGGNGNGNGGGGGGGGN